MMHNVTKAVHDRGLYLFTFCLYTSMLHQWCNANG